MFLVSSTATLVLDVMFQRYGQVDLFIMRTMQYLLFVGTVTHDSLSKDDKANVVLLSSYFLFLQQVNREIWLIVK